MEYEKYKEVFVGKKYEKIINQKFSIFTLLFGPYYWAYRKLLLPALILLAVNSLIIFISLLVIKSPIAFGVYFPLAFLVQIIAAFMFRNIYNSYAEKKVKKIIDADVSDSESEELELCKKRGGTSILYCFLAIILFSLITSAISSLFVLNVDSKKVYTDDKDVGIEEPTRDHKQEKDNDQNEVDTNSVEEETEESDENTNNTSKDNSSKVKASLEERKDGRFSYNIITNLFIDKYIDVKFPDDFEKEYNEAYEYEYYHGDISEKDVTVLVAVIDSDSAEDVINDVAKKNSVEDENMYSVELNDLKWYIAGYQTRKSIVYYNAFDHNSGKVVLFRYEIQNTLEDDSSYVDIINSIFEKQVEVEDELVEEDENKPRKINNNSKNETNNNSSKNESNTNTNSSENEIEEDEDEKENTSKNETNTNTKKSNSITINSVSNNTIEDDETEEDE